MQVRQFIMCVQLRCNNLSEFSVRRVLGIKEGPISFCIPKRIDKHQKCYLGLLYRPRPTYSFGFEGLL